MLKDVLKPKENLTKFLVRYRIKIYNREEHKYQPQYKRIFLWFIPTWINIGDRVSKLKIAQETILDQLYQELQEIEKKQKPKYSYHFLELKDLKKNHVVEDDAIDFEDDEDDFEEELDEDTQMKIAELIQERIEQEKLEPGKSYWDYQKFWS